MIDFKAGAEKYKYSVKDNNVDKNNRGLLMRFLNPKLQFPHQQGNYPWLGSSLLTLYHEALKYTAKNFGSFRLTNPISGAKRNDWLNKASGELIDRQHWLEQFVIRQSWIFWSCGNR